MKLKQSFIKQIIDNQLLHGNITITTNYTYHAELHHSIKAEKYFYLITRHETRDPSKEEIVGFYSSLGDRI